MASTSIRKKGYKDKKEGRIITRRDFMRGTVGAALGVSLLGVERAWGDESKDRLSLVTVVRNEKVMDVQGSTVDIKILREMLDQAVMLTTGKKNAKDAWRRLVKRKDKVGIVPTRSVNPTHSELYVALEASLVEAGISKDNIINAQGRLSFSGVDTYLHGLDFAAGLEGSLDNRDRHRDKKLHYVFKFSG